MISSEQFSNALVNSITTALAATLISLLLALAAAFSLERSSIRFKAIFSVIFMMPMLIPSISHAFGLVALFGNNGLITNMINLDSSIYGFWGIVIGSVMYSFPVAFLMFASILRYENALPYKAAEILGISAFHRFFGITLPYLRKPLIAAFFAVFTMVITDYGVPLMIGGKTMTLSVLMYNKAVSMLDYDSGSVIGAFLLIPAIVAFIVDVLNPEKSENAFITEKLENSKKTGPNIASYITSVLISLAILAPVVAFLLMVFETKYPVDSTFTVDHILKTINKGAGDYLLNSLIYSALAAVMGAVLAFICAYMTSRMRGRIGNAVHLISITSMAIPGLVLGLSYVIFFHDNPIYGTIFIVVLVNVIHFFASPYLMMYNTLSKLNMNLEAVGISLGVSRIRIILDVILPKVRFTIIEMGVYFFVNSMITISAVSFLAPPSPKAVSLMINQFEAQRLMECAAFVSLLVLFINIAIKIVEFASKRRTEKKSQQFINSYGE